MNHSINTFQFDILFNIAHAEEYFINKILYRNGGGRDNMSPKTYWEQFKDNTSSIIKKCKFSDYRFSPYKEQLILKGRSKLPRCISIPTVRDRLVLGLLNEYLQTVFPECVNHKTPNQCVREIKSFIAEHPEPISFFKSDFSQFYDNINQEKLMSVLRTRIHDERPLKLIIDSIQNPTTGYKKEKKVLSLKGVPQGLAISNILASIYMMEFDRKMKDIGAKLYLRYVDDILLLQPYFRNPRNMILEFLQANDMQVTLSEEKTATGILEHEALDFIGYVFQNDCVTIRTHNVDLFIRRIAHAVTQLKRQLQNPALRPRFIKEDKQLVDFYIEEINEQISGMKYGSTLFGWLPYFQECNDIQLLYRLDKIVKRLIGKVTEIDTTKLHSFVKSYHDIRERSGVHYVLNYDELDTIARREAFLIKKGKISDSLHYTEEEINQIYSNYCSNRKKAIERNIGYFE